MTDIEQRLAKLEGLYDKLTVVLAGIGADLEVVKASLNPGEDAKRSRARGDSPELEALHLPGYDAMRLQDKQGVLDNIRAAREIELDRSDREQRERDRQRLDEVEQSLARLQQTQHAGSRSKPKARQA